MKMNNVLTAQEQMEAYVIMNINRIQSIIRPYKLQRDALMISESGLWHIDIEQQYNKIIKSVLAVELSLNLQITPLDSLVFTESLNIEELL